MLLSDAIDEYLSSRRGEGVAKNTLRNIESDLRRLLVSVGNIPTDRFDGKHVDALFAKDALTRGPATMNNTHSNLCKFFAWCRNRRYMHRDSDPMFGRRHQRVPRQDRSRIGVHEFGPLLDATPNPRNRMILSLGLYLFLRQSEMSSIRLSDVDLDGGEIRVIVHKTGDLDYMPICAELDTELRRWLSSYESANAPLGRDFFLTPARTWGPRAVDGNGRFVKGARYDQLDPRRPAQRLECVAQESLEAINFPTRNPDGTPRREGIHTLRRSGARALFDQLASDGYDGALQELKTWLHHASATMTEHYLGLQAERRKRDARVKGRQMFKAPEGATILKVAQ